MLSKGSEFWKEKETCQTPGDFNNALVTWIEKDSGDSLHAGNRLNRRLTVSKGSRFFSKLLQMYTEVYKKMIFQSPGNG